MSNDDSIQSKAVPAIEVDLPSIRMLRTIECLAAHGPLTYEAMRKRLGISKTSVWRIVATLRDAGWVRVRQAGSLVELDHRLDDLFAMAAFSDREFAQVFDALTGVAESSAVYLDLYVLDSNTGPVLVGSTRRRLTSTPEAEVDSEAIALAINSAAAPAQRNRNLATRQDSEGAAARNLAAGHRELTRGYVWASDGALIASVRGKMGTAAAIRIAIKGRDAERRVAIAAFAELRRVLSGLVDSFGQQGSEPL